MWPNETNGVISCSGTSAFRLLLSGYKNKTVKITSLFCKQIDILQKEQMFLIPPEFIMLKQICSNYMIKSNFSHIRHLSLISPTKI